jgi:hypothetical protein
MPHAVYGMSHTHLMRCLHRVSGEYMMSLMSGILGTHELARGSRATGHVVSSEPSRTRRWVWSHMTCGDTGVLSGGGPGASVTWQRQSLPAHGGGLRAARHVATPEPSPAG